MMGMMAVRRVKAAAQRLFSVERCEGDWVIALHVRSMITGCSAGMR